MSAESDVTLEIVEETPVELNVVEETSIEISLQETGADGLSAYQVWLSLGNTGTEQDFLDSLQGEPGATEAAGVSYSNETSGMTADDVQAALDELAGRQGLYYQYIYDSSAPEQVGNVFNNWADLIDAIDGREVRIQFRQNEVIPAGTWDLDYQIWIGNGQNPDGGGLVIEFPEGCHISSALNWSCQNGLNLYSSSVTHPTYVMTVAHVISFDRTAIYTDNIEFIKVTGTGLVAIQCANGFGLYNDPGSGLGNYEVFNIDSVAYGTVVVTVKASTSANIQNNTIRSATPIVYGWLIQSSEAISGYATQANLAPFSVNFNGVPGGDGGAIFSNAKVIGFIQGNPAGITSSNVADALAELAARVAILEGA